MKESFEQLVAEVMKPVKYRGVMINRWVPRVSGIRNEALDCLVYCLASLEAWKNRGNRLNQYLLSIPPVKETAHERIPYRLGKEAIDEDRKSVVLVRRVSVSVEFGGSSKIKKK